MTDAPTVNKDEMARLMGVSLPTFTSLIKTNPDFPIVAGGARGIPYAFDPTAVLEWKKRRLEQERAAVARHDEFVSAFDFGDDQSDRRGVTPGQQLQLLKAEKMKRDMEMEAGQLVDIATVRQALMTAIAVLGKRLDNLPAILGREHNLPAPMQQTLRKQIDDCRRLLERDVAAALGAGSSEGLAETLFAAQ